MVSFKIEWRSSTKKDLRKIQPQQVIRILEAVNSLCKDPRPSNSCKLSGSERTYRLRVGDYRVIYEIFEDRIVIEVLKVRHRKEAYRA